jgi:hypothetical protein
MPWYSTPIYQPGWRLEQQRWHQRQTTRRRRRGHSQQMLPPGTNSTASTTSQNKQVHLLVFSHSLRHVPLSHHTCSVPIARETLKHPKPRTPPTYTYLKVIWVAQIDSSTSCIWHRLMAMGLSRPWVPNKVEQVRADHPCQPAKSSNQLRPQPACTTKPRQSCIAYVARLVW